MTIATFNQQDKQAVQDALFACCGSSKWATELMKSFPFASEDELVKKATDIWYNYCNEADWLESFTHHPKIGDVKSLEEKFASTKHLAGAEQAGVAAASSNVIQQLADANKAYEEKFGFICIVCATGKSADEMLRLLQDRLKNSYEEELAIAMGEQHKITITRFKKLLNESDWSFLKVSQLTTHVLDTSIGKPGKNITIKLRQPVGEKWLTITQGVTNTDGRIPDLLPPSKLLQPGLYKIVFETAAYFEAQAVTGFYPEVEIQFTVFDDQHYHVPLLVNPFGYSTYRGS
jgi:5-hydroxyisourate hydrolase / 2-oxo-4-hydroxy-4-carboxy-5-ureidoimidazoline decarboxylase